MGCATTFTGSIQTEPPLTAEEVAEFRTVTTNW
jgi:hypothetical protein